MKPKFDSTITLGHILMFLGFVIPAVTYGVGFASRVSAMEKDVARHENLLNKINETQVTALQTQALLGQRLADHLDLWRGTK